MKMDQVCDPDLVDRMISEGFITANRHPSEPLTLYTYTARAQYANDMRKFCRCGIRCS